MTADTLRAIIAKLSMTQGEFARALGYTRRSIERFLAGDPIPKRTQRAIRDLYNEVMNKN
jgi:hypothetical protein